MLSVTVTAWAPVQELRHLSWTAALLTCFSKTGSPTHTGCADRHLPVLYTCCSVGMGSLLLLQTWLAM